uniref:Uncharacterized protein n=1 Tax=Triticum urartu TaxID=4572 RepID=A0A8R7TGP7_TRIUA
MVCIFYIALTSNSNYIFCLNCCVPMRSWDNSDMSRCPVRSWVHYLVTSSANCFFKATEWSEGWSSRHR